MDQSAASDSVEMTVVTGVSTFPVRVISLTSDSGDDGNEVFAKNSSSTSSWSKKKVYECEKCGKQFNKSFNKKRHATKVCLRPTAPPEPVKAVCPLCGFEEVKPAMVQHFETVHRIELERKSLLFESRIEFFKWKAAQEKETNARYVQSRGARPTKKGWTKLTYYCHRDGHFKSKGCNVRKMKSIGSNKINGHCPARMDTSDLPDGTIAVKFLSTHLGHSMDPMRLTLTEDEREQVARQIKCERVDTSDDENTVGNLTSESLANISRSFRTRQYVRRREANESLDDWVDSILDASSMVRLYEKHGEDFTIVAAMESQIEILRQFGDQVVLLEPVEENLWSLLVVDDIKEGFPCAFLITSGGNNALKIFLMTIKVLTGSLKPKLLISDFEGHSAWEQAFGEPTSKAMASRHISRTCLDEETASALMHCAELTEGDEFLKAFKDVSAKLTVPEILKEDFSLWVRCLQQPFTQEMNSILEPTIRLLKHLAKLHDVISFPDKLLYNLIKATRDHIFDRVLVLNNSSQSIRQKRLETRHRLSLKLSIHNVVENYDDTFTVPGTDESYTVKRSSVPCNCTAVCHECRTCIHKYTCTCFDSAIKGYMCRHVHLVCRSLLAREEPASVEKDPLSETVENLTIQKRLLTNRCLAIIESMKTIKDINEFEDAIQKFESNLSSNPDSEEAHYVLQLVADDNTDQTVNVKDEHLLQEGQQFVMILEDGRNAKVELVKA